MVGDYNKRVADLSSLISPLSSDSCWLTLSSLLPDNACHTISSIGIRFHLLKREPMSLGPIKNTTSVKMTILLSILCIIFMDVVPWLINRWYQKKKISNLAQSHATSVVSCNLLFLKSLIFHLDFDNVLFLPSFVSTLCFPSQADNQHQHQGL